VLAGSRLGDDARLAQSPGQQQLAQRVVDLVAAGMVQVLSLQPDIRTAGVLGQPLGEMEVARPAHPGVVGSILFPEAGIVLDLVETLLQLR